MVKSEKIVISFPSLECEERGFEVLTGTGRKFYYVGNKQVEISQSQRAALEVQGVPHTLVKN